MTSQEESASYNVSVYILTQLIEGLYWKYTFGPKVTHPQSFEDLRKIALYSP